MHVRRKLVRSMHVVRPAALHLLRDLICDRDPNTTTSPRRPVSWPSDSNIHSAPPPSHARHPATPLLRRHRRQGQSRPNRARPRFQPDQQHSRPRAPPACPDDSAALRAHTIATVLATALARSNAPPASHTDLAIAEDTVGRSASLSAGSTFPTALPSYMHIQ